MRTGWPLRRQHIPRLALAGVLVVLGALAVMLASPAGQAAAGVAPGVTQRASVQDDGSQGQAGEEGGVENAAISGDGRYEAFDDPEKLDPLADNGFTNVYVRDLTSPGHTVLISRGVEEPIIEGPAQFGDAKAAPNAAPNASPAASVGTTDPPIPEAAAEGNSDAPSISANGRYVAFETTATNIASPDLPEGDGTLDENENFVQDVYICDRDPENTGTLDHKRADGSMDYVYTLVGRIDTDDGGREFSNSFPTLSADASEISWQQQEQGTTIRTMVFAHLNKNAAGAIEQPNDDQYVAVRSSDSNDQNDDTFDGRVSADGNHIVFLAFCSDCADDSEITETMVDVEDLTTNTTARVDLDTTGAPMSGDENPDNPAISGDGSVVAFQENPFDESASQIIVVKPGDPKAETVASQTTAGQTGEGTTPALSTDGRYLSFETNANGMFDGVDPTEGGGYGYGPPRPLDQVVVRDLVVDAARVAAGQSRLPAELASPSITTNCEEDPPAGVTCGGDADSFGSALDADGSVVAFVSNADDLVPEDTNGSSDAFARRFQPTVTADPVDFGTVPLGGAATRTATVTQSGFGPVEITGLQITGTNSPEFSVFPAQNCVQDTLHETETCLISLEFVPASAGPQAAQLVLTLGDGADPVSIPLTGIGEARTSSSSPPSSTTPPPSSSTPPPTSTTPPPVLVGSFQASPNPLVFPGPSLALSTSAPKTVTITDNGTGPITIKTISLLTGPNLFPGDYTITKDTCLNTTLQPGRTCQVTVTDTPHGAGPRPGALEFTDTADNSPQLVGLRSTGATPTLQASPAVVVAGRVTTITGTNWPPNAQIRLTVPQLPGIDTVTATTKADGTLNTPLVVFSHAEVGTWAINGAAPNTTLQAGTNMLVVLGTYQPPGFTSREGD